LTIQDSDLFETQKGETLLTATKDFHAQNNLESTVGDNFPSVNMTKKQSEMTQNTDIFALSQDSTVKLQGTLLSSFVTNDGKMAGSTIKSGISGSAMGDSLAYSNTGLTFAKEASRVVPMAVIEEGDGSSKADREDFSPDDDDFDDIDRFEDVDVNEVSIDTSTKSNKRKQKAILSPEQIEQAHKEREGEQSTSNRTQAEYAIQ
jgi:hypothetical protein